MNNEIQIIKNEIAVHLPDVSKLEKSKYSGNLSKVGMGQIEMPILITSALSNDPVLMPARINAYVSLDAPNVKGIHMSRLYLGLKNTLMTEVLTAETLKKILTHFIESHESMSKSAYVEVKFNLPVERKALLSGEMGYRLYPITMKAELKNQIFDFYLGTEVLYSSTCPCSAALSKQIMSEEFVKYFANKDNVQTKEVEQWLISEKSSVAFPHAQRSLARINIKSQSISAVQLIDMVEESLGTPVQAAVKRSDEQEFARLNAQNLMFCEDAARKVRTVFENEKSVTDYYIFVEHQESLHPHDAVSIVVKGIPGGFEA